MNVWIRRAGIAALAVGGLGASLAIVGQHLGDRKLNRRLAVAVNPVAVPTTPEALARGEYLFRSRGCSDCHGGDGTGRDVIKDESGMWVHAPNITPVAGSVAEHYGTRDWVRTIRHGVRPDGRPLLIMPSEDYNRLTDADVGALIAYLGTLTPAAGGAAIIELPMAVKVLYAVGVVEDAAEKIDHTRPPPAPVPDAVTVEHGAYVAAGCQSCHGPHFGGGHIPGTPPAWPAAANLTPGAGGVMHRYPTAETFMAMLRSGRRPDGSAISPVMPFATLGALNDTDAAALYLYLRSLEPRATGTR